MRQSRLVLALIVMALICCSWGFLVHRTVHQLAIYQLPNSMQPFFYRNMKYIVDSAPRPDMRRNQDPTEASKHFIDLEAFKDWNEDNILSMPREWDQAVRKYSKDTLEKYGYVPYHIITIKNRLTDAFRNRDKDSILFYATDLGHYIGDVNVPLHTTINYDGQLTNQKGLHSLWESVVPEIEIDQYTLYTRHRAKYLNNPEESIWQAIRHSYTLVKDVLGMEKEVTKNFTDSTKYRTQIRRGREVRSYTSGFAKAYSKALGTTINDQLRRSSEMIADFWYTAWVDAGRPDLSGLLSAPFERKDKKVLKDDLKTWKHEELQEKKLLLSRQGVQGGD